MSTLEDRLDGDPISSEDWEKLRRKARFSLPATASGDIGAVLLPYQQRLLTATALNQVVVCEKSRRIGMTWGVAADAVLHAGSQKAAGGMDVLYIGYNLDMAREFIDVCGMWARAFQHAASEVQEFIFTETDEKGAAQSIQAFRIRFASGFEIVALTSKPRSLRGRQGYLIFDEAAFHDDLAGMLKAGMAFLIWGGKVLVISTHDGQDNPFNEYIEGIRSKKNKGEIVRVTFDEALQDGLYERICLVTGKDWSPEAEAAWRKDIRDFYGADASEELDAVPGEGGGRLIPLSHIEACMTKDYEVRRWYPETPDFVDAPSSVRRASMQRWLEEEIEPLLKQMPSGLMKSFGEDFGMRADRTSIAVGLTDQKTDRHVRFIVELFKCPFDQQWQVLEYIGERLAPLQAGILDANGNGMPIAQKARQRFGPERIIELNATDAWYREYTTLFKAAFEDGTIHIPADTDIREDLRQFRLINGVGKIPKSVRTTGEDKLKRHADSAIAILNFFAATHADAVEYGYQTPRDLDQERRPGMPGRMRMRADNYDDFDITSDRGAW